MEKVPANVEQPTPEEERLMDVMIHLPPRGANEPSHDYVLRVARACIAVQPKPLAKVWGIYHAPKKHLTMMSKAGCQLYLREYKKETGKQDYALVRVHVMPAGE